MKHAFGVAGAMILATMTGDGSMALVGYGVGLVAYYVLPALLSSGQTSVSFPQGSRTNTHETMKTFKFMDPNHGPLYLQATDQLQANRQSKVQFPNAYPVGEA
jgi:hypothetical protein